MKDRPDNLSELSRFYAPALPDSPAVEVALEESEAHHATNVLRLGIGREVELFDGQGLVARGTIAFAKRSDVRVALRTVERVSRPGRAVHLAFAVPKGKRLDWLLEKATELTAASLQPVIFQRSVAGGEELSDNKRARWLGHCIAAAKQCGLNFLPLIHEPLALPQYLANLPAGPDLKLLGAPEADTPSLRGRLAGLADSPAGGIRLLVGPEGGFTEEEIAAARTAGFLPARLGHTTLRVETAAIALLAGCLALDE